MKANHRHELKTNELAEWIANLPQWAKENLRMIIYVSIVVALVGGSAWWHWYNKNVESVQRQLRLTNLIAQLSQSKTRIIQAQASGIDASYMLIKPAEDLQAAARNAKSDLMAAFALIKAAEALRAELHYRQTTMNQAELEAAINRAKAVYSEVIETYLSRTPNPSLMARAKLGLGLCEEEVGNFDEAEQIYRDIVANSDFEDTIAAAQAKLRLNTMADYRQKVVFKTPPKPAPIKQVEPSPLPLDIIPPDFNLGALTPNTVPDVPDSNVPYK